MGKDVHVRFGLSGAFVVLLSVGILTNIERHPAVVQYHFRNSNLLT